jgi:DNA-binding transcriptional ArsR family regulator
MKSRDIPLAELTLRKYERPYKIHGRNLVSKLCLSLGLLQPGDSRDVIVDVLYVLLKHKKLNAKQIEEEVIAFRKKGKLPMVGIASSNLRRQVRRLRESFLVEKVGTDYRITENESLSNIYKEKITQFMLNSITSRVEEYIQAVDKEFKEEKPKKGK